METQKADARNEIGEKGYIVGDGSTYLASAVTSTPATDADLKTHAKNEIHGIAGTNPLTIKDIGDADDKDAYNNWYNTHKNSGTRTNYTWHDHPFIIITVITEVITGVIYYLIGPNQKKNGWSETGKTVHGGDATTSTPRAHPSPADQATRGSYSNFIVSKAAGTITHHIRNNSITTMKSDFFYNVKARNTY